MHLYHCQLISESADATDSRTWSARLCYGSYCTSKGKTVNLAVRHQTKKLKYKSPAKSVRDLQAFCSAIKDNPQVVSACQSRKIQQKCRSWTTCFGILLLLVVM